MNQLLSRSILKVHRNHSFNKILIKPQQLYYGTSSSYCSIVLRDQSTIANALNFSVKKKSSILGTQIHARVIKLGFCYDIFILNNLIRSYLKCGLFNAGLKVFDEMTERNLVSWTLIISGAAQNGEFNIGFEAFLEMRRNGLIPNEFTLGSLFKICSYCNDGLIIGLCIHCFTLKSGFEQNPFVGSSIMNMYTKGNDIEASEKVFKSVKRYKDVVCWNAMIGGYAQGGFGFEAVNTAYLMHSEGIIMDEYSFINAINGCSILGKLNIGEQIHGLIVVYGMVKSTSVMNSLIDMYFKNGEVKISLKLFNSMVHKDIVSWNTMFSGYGYSQDLDIGEIVGLFNEFMVSDLKPNLITFSALINLSGKVNNPCFGLQYYCLALRYGFSDNSLVINSLISMFSRCGLIDNNINYNMEVSRLFRDLWVQGVEINDITISRVLEACLNSGDLQMGKQIHAISIKSGILVCGLLIKLYIKCGLFNDSFKFFDDVNETCLVNWSVMVSTLGREGHYFKAMEFLIFMRRSGERLDEFILSSVLDTCASLAFLYLTKLMHSLVIKMGFELEMCVVSAMIDAYSKCGDIESAKLAFHLSSREETDVVVFNTMIMAYANHGLPLEAIKIFDKMKEVNMKPSQATFVSVISACRHVGLVDLGRNLFESIRLKYGMEPSRDNYGCLVDLLSRNGFIEDAKNIIESMPFPSWPAIWRSLLNGCIIHGNREMGELAYKKMFNLFPKDATTNIMYSKLYSQHGNWEDVAILRNEMIDEGVQKDVGNSWIEVYK